MDSAEPVKEGEDFVEGEFLVRSPATGEEVSRCPLMGRDDVDEAVESAREKFGEWSQSSFKQRRAILGRGASILAENASHYAELISLENGKTGIDAMLADIFPTAHLMKYYAKNAERFLKPVKVSGSLLLPGRKAYYTFEPKGVVGVMSPWNYPFTLSAGPVVSAVAAGNTVVLKPASQTTRSGLMVKEILEKAGLPQGVVNVVTGNGRVTGQALIEHPDLDMLFFTGSTPVGRKVNVAAAQRLIPAVMELGGKDAAIVTKNADLDRAARGTVFGAFTNCGQTCIGAELILVDREVYEPFLDKIIELTKKLRTGQSSGELGPMTMESQLKVVEDQLEDAKKKGARILTGGERDREGPGLFFPPTLLADTAADMKVRREETFGPLKPIIPYQRIEDAIEVANGTEYGLSGSIYTRDLDEGRRIARSIKTGAISINDSLIAYAFPSLPFGGMKNSGVGRYHGKMGLRAFTDVKSITEFGWGLKGELYWFPLPEGSEAVAEDAFKVMFSDSISKRMRAALGTAKSVFKIWRSNGAGK